MRQINSKIAITVLFVSSLFFGGTAAAVEFTIVNQPSASVLPGDQIQLDIVLRNPGLLPINGLGASAHGYDESILRFNSGQAVDNYFNQVCVGPGQCFGGLTNLVGGDLHESSIGAQGNRVQIALSASISPTTNSGEIDQGLDQAPGSAQFRLIFDVVGVGFTTILIDTTYQGDGVVLAGGFTQATGASFSLTIVPEPGTALLLGMGLWGLAASARRRPAQG